MNLIICPSCTSTILFSQTPSLFIIIFHVDSIRYLRCDKLMHCLIFEPNWKYKFTIQCSLFSVCFQMFSNSIRMPSMQFNLSESNRARLCKSDVVNDRLNKVRQQRIWAERQLPTDDTEAKRKR